MKGGAGRVIYTVAVAVDLEVSFSNNLSLTETEIRLMKLTACILSTAVLLTSTLLPRGASASCGGILASLGDRYDAADAVFVGRALDVTEVKLPTPSNYSPGTPYREHRTRFEVEEVFKGVKEKTVLICPEEGRPGCVVEFTTSNRYLIFASHDAKSGVLRAALDGPTGPVSDRAEALVYCQRVAVTGRAPSLIGTITDQNPTGLDDWYLRRSPLAGAGVALEGGGRTHEAPTDANGVYYFEDIPSGKYSVRLRLPEGYRLLRSTSVMPSNRPDALTISGVGEIEIKGSGHAAKYFDVTGCGSLAGEIIDGSGAPAAETIVLLVTKEQASDLENANWNTQTHTDERGRFRFDLVPSGEFVLLFNPHLEDAFDRSAPAFYYRSADAPARATLVRVASARHLDLGKIKPPTPFPNVTVDVSTLDSANPERKRFIICTSLQPNGREHIFLTDDRGRARLHLRSGVRFRIEVELDEGESAGEPVEIVAKDYLAPLRFVVTSAPAAHDGAVGPARGAGAGPDDEGAELPHAQACTQGGGRGRDDLALSAVLAAIREIVGGPWPADDLPSLRDELVPARHTGPSPGPLERLRDERLRDGEVRSRSSKRRER
jgi:hypothetical protein